MYVYQKSLYVLYITVPESIGLPGVRGLKSDPGVSGLIPGEGVI